MIPKLRSAFCGKFNIGLFANDRQWKETEVNKQTNKCLVKLKLKNSTDVASL